MTTNDGGPAFPVPIAMSTNANGDPYVIDSSERCIEGMSLRDWFAGQVLKGQESQPDNSTYNKIRDGHDINEWRASIRRRTATYCYEMADDMIAARTRTQTKEPTQ
jgi:hypothetical protein